MTALTAGCRATTHRNGAGFLCLGVRYKTPLCCGGLFGGEIQRASQARFGSGMSCAFLSFRYLEIAL